MSFIPRNIWRYCSGDKFVIDDTPRAFISQDQYGVVLETITEPKISEGFTYERLQELGDAERMNYQRDGYSVDMARRKYRHDGLHFADFPAKERGTIMWRKLYVDQLLRMLEEGKAVRTDDAIKAIRLDLKRYVDDRYEEMQRDGKRSYAGTEYSMRRAPKARTLLKWLWYYEDAGFQLEGLRDYRCKSGNHLRRFSPEVVALLTKCVQDYATRRRKTQKRIAEDTRTTFEAVNEERAAQGLRPLRIPGMSAVRRAIKKMNPFHVYCQRYGLNAARKKYALFERGVPLQFPGENVSVDECKVDLMTLATTTFIWHALTDEQRALIPRGRRWISVALCATTKCVLALHVCDKPSGKEAIKTLALATQDKSDISRVAGAKGSWSQHCGLPFVVTDQGSSYLSYEFAETCAALGTTHDAPAGATPWLRPFIERVFGTFNTDLFQEMNGRTFSNIVERGDFDSKGAASLTDDQLALILVRYIVDVYHNRPHEGLLGETPADAWERLKNRYTMLAPPLPKDRRAIFGWKMKRKVRGNGVRICGIQYSCSALQRYFLDSHDDEHEVEVRLNPENIGTVDILIEGRWMPAKAIGGGFDGIRIDMWIDKVRSIRQKNHAKAILKRPVIAEALADIRAINTDSHILMDLTPFSYSVEQIAYAETSVFLGLEAEPLDMVDSNGEGLIATSFKVEPGDIKEVMVAETPPTLADEETPVEFYGDDDLDTWSFVGGKSHD